MEKRMNKGFFKPIIEDKSIDGHTLDSRGNIYFLSENKIYKWHYDYDYIEPLFYIDVRIEMIHVVQERDDLLIVLSDNSIYSVKDGYYFFKAEKTISKIVNCGYDLFLMMDGEYFILRDYTCPAVNHSTAEKITFHGIEKSEYGIDDIVINSSGLGFIRAPLLRHYYKFKYEGFNEIQVEYQMTCERCLPVSQLSISYYGNPSVVFLVYKEGIVWCQWNESLFRDDNCWYHLVGVQDEYNELAFQTKNILWKDIKDNDSIGLVLDGLQFINIDKDGNGIMLSDDFIAKIQLYEPSSSTLVLLRDFSRLCQERISTRDLLLNKKLDLPIFSVRVADNKFF